MLVIYNPTAGRRRVSRLWAVLDVLVAHGVRLEVVQTQRSGDASALARDASAAGIDLIVAAGGDGTIAEVATGLLEGSATRLGIIPLGTANVLAHELALPNDPVGLASALVSGATMPLWPGIVRSAAGTRLFVQMLGIGFDAHVVHRMSRPVKRVLGKGAYVVQTLRELSRYRFPPVRLLIDGEPATAGSVIIAKGTLYGGPYVLTPHATPNTPGFSVILFEHGGIAPALLAGAALPLNMLGKVPGASHRRASVISVLDGSILPVQTDGDPAGLTPLQVSDAQHPIVVQVAKPRIMGGVLPALSPRGSSLWKPAA